MAALQEGLVPLRIADIDAHGFVPAIGDAKEPRIKRRPQFRDQIGKRIGKILVLAAAKPVASHHYPAAEAAVVRIGVRKGAALPRREQSLEDRAALGIEIVVRLRPIDRIDARGDAGRGDGMDDIFDV